MKISTITFIAIGAILASAPVYARSAGGAGGSHGMMNSGGGAGGGFQQGYSGTAAGPVGNMVTKTGFVKERTNEEDHMDGKEVKKDENDDDALPTDEQDDAMDNEEKEDTDGKADK